MSAKLLSLMEHHAPGLGSTGAYSPGELADLRRKCLEAVLREYNPVGFGETLLARNAARFAAELLRNEQLSDAVEVGADHALQCLMLPLLDQQQSSVSLYVPERLSELSRAGARSAATFYRSLEQLAELQRRRTNIDVALAKPDSRFANEAQCITYLGRRFELGHQVCRECNEPARGSWIAVRRAWNCSACQTQTCARHGTVLARSRVPLKVWFHAIRVLLLQPNITVVELAAAVGVRRVPTVRTIARKVRAAMMADNATSLLVGLDGVFLPTTE